MNKSKPTGKGLGFTSDGRAEQYDLEKIKLLELEAEYRFPLFLRRLRSSENCTVGVESRSGRINQSQCSTPSIVIGWFFRFCFRLWQSTFHWIISDEVISGVGRKWEGSDSSDPDTVELMTPLSTPIFDKRSYDSDNDTDSDSVASENQPQDHAEWQLGFIPKEKSE